MADAIRKTVKCVNTTVVESGALTLKANQFAIVVNTDGKGERSGNGQGKTNIFAKAHGVVRGKKVGFLWQESITKNISVTPEELAEFEAFKKSLIAKG